MMWHNGYLSDFECENCQTVTMRKYMRKVELTKKNVNMFLFSSQ